MYTMATEAIKRVISASVLDFAGTLVLEFSGNRIHGRRWWISPGLCCSSSLERWGLDVYVLYPVKHICIGLLKMIGSRGGLCSWEYICWVWLEVKRFDFIGGGEVLRSFDGWEIWRMMTTTKCEGGRNGGKHVNAWINVLLHLLHWCRR